MRIVSCKFKDSVISQDPSEPEERVGELRVSHVSETATWVVNGKERFTLTIPELYALVEAATDE